MLNRKIYKELSNENAVFINILNFLEYFFIYYFYASFSSRHDIYKKNCRSQVEVGIEKIKYLRPLGNINQHKLWISTDRC